MAITYALYSASKETHYTGSSRNDSVEIRLMNHNAGRVRSTKSGRPWIPVLVERYETYSEARRRELFLKTGVGRKILREQLLKKSHRP